MGYRMTDCRLEGETPSMSLRLANLAAYWLVFRNNPALARAGSLPPGLYRCGTDRA